MVVYDDGPVVVDGAPDVRFLRARWAYGSNWDRLVQIKRRYDRDNIFHLNQNIDPNSV